MPELPEVEILRRHCDEVAVGHSIRSCSGVMGHEDPTGQTIIRAERIGKKLLLHLTRGTLVFSFGMTGDIRIVPVSNVRAMVELDNSTTLYYTDPRNFGKVEYLMSVPRLGPDLLSDAPIIDAVLCNLGVCYRPLKSAIMDQHIVAGIGNILANETLGTLAIDPYVTASALTRPQVGAIIYTAKAIALRLIREKYVPAHEYGGMSAHEGSYVYYQHDGGSCPICRGKIIRTNDIDGRATFYCPRCVERRVLRA